MDLDELNELFEDVLEDFKINRIDLIESDPTNPHINTMRDKTYEKINYYRTRLRKLILDSNSLIDE